MGANYDVKTARIGVTIPASQTNAPVTFIPVTATSRLSLVVDVYVGKVAAGGTPTVKLQDSTGQNIWSDVKASASITASTNTTVTLNTSTSVFTAASHGFTDGQLVALNSTGTLPGTFAPGEAVYIQNSTTNTFQLSYQQGVGSLPVSASQAGSGTLTVTPVRVVTIRVNNAVTADQAVLPLRPVARLVATTGASDSIQVISVSVGASY
jgi:hypothetical protein